MYPYTTKDRKAIEDALYQFMKNHRNHFSLEEELELLYYLEKEDVKDYFTSTFLAQVYEELKLVKPECSIYYHMMQIIKENFDIRKDIIEIASGILPILGHSIRREQIKLGRGTLTVYDSKVWRDYPTTAILKKESFTLETEVKPNSVLISIFPCEVNNIMIEKALNEKLEFCIALCGCNHSGIKFLPPREYHNRLIDYLYGHLPKDKKLKLYQFPKECFGNDRNGFPILVVKDKETQKIKKYITSIQD